MKQLFTSPKSIFHINWNNRLSKLHIVPFLFSIVIFIYNVSCALHELFNPFIICVHKASRDYNRKILFLSSSVNIQPTSTTSCRRIRYKHSSNSFSLFLFSVLTPDKYKTTRKNIFVFTYKKYFDFYKINFYHHFLR